jgi:hypothetical protein
MGGNGADGREHVLNAMVEFGHHQLKALLALFEHCFIAAPLSEQTRENEG